jgi:hypothetical protein
MPTYVLVTERDDVPHVLMAWCVEGGRTLPIAELKQRCLQPVVFRDRWRAKRFLQKRNAWRDWRVLREDRL